MTDVNGWAGVLVDDNRQRRDFTLPWGADGAPSLDDAYRIQDAVLAGLSGDRGPLGGYKVAITAKPMQEMMGLTEPLGGLIHAADIAPAPFELSLGAFHTPAVEFEVAVRLGSDVPHPEVPYSRDTITHHVGEVITSFEIVDTRGAVPAEIGAIGLVADRCLCSGAILGEGTADHAGLDLAEAPVELTWNGEIVETGVTGAAMGHPFEGLAWVANHMAERGRSLKAGEIVLTGSAFPPKPVANGDVITYRIGGIGEATITVVD